MKRALGMLAAATAAICTASKGRTASFAKSVSRFARRLSKSVSTSSSGIGALQLVASEEYMVRKIADLLNLPLADFLEAKIRARDNFR